MNGQAARTGQTLFIPPEQRILPATPLSETPTQKVSGWLSTGRSTHAGEGRERKSGKGEEQQGACTTAP